uniref:RNA binding protein n=1 Tax=Amorphochlora amoebiformis TaxID=1561963 RepID=A0A0H5BHL9_9EUKA|nr:RNA binding protein [Amorphochlora amoebiformis]|mmetsp:Transcript_27905/g.44416  ORF Transcript_27905/g.44416 Transcript_27905/m.44416 type:complete len:122 (-) Transcript_27905:1641-2006(-)
MEKNNLKVTLNQKSQMDYVRKIVKDNIWYYRDRMNVARGPCDLYILRTCYSSGIIDENTIIWGNGLDTWICLKNIKGLLNMIKVPEVQLFHALKREVTIKPLLNEIRENNIYKRKYWVNGL